MDSSKNAGWVGAVKYVDHIAITLIACSALGIAWFSTSALPECRSADGSIADWLQAIGTVVAAGVATTAFVTWRKPDDARRRGDTAQSLLRLSRNVENSLLSARIRRTSYIRTAEPTQADVARMLKPVGEDIEDERLNGARNLVNELDTYRAEATYMFGRSAQEKIDTMVSCYNDLANARELILDIMDNPELVTASEPEGGVKGMRTLAKRNLEILGVAWVKKDRKRTDEFEQKLRVAGNELREILVMHLPK